MYPKVEAGDTEGDRNGVRERKHDGGERDRTREQVLNLLKIALCAHKSRRKI